MSKLWSFLTGRWVVVRTGWPYNPGWGTWNERRNTICDSGLSKPRAKNACVELNARRRRMRADFLWDTVFIAAMVAVVVLCFTEIVP